LRIDHILLTRELVQRCKSCSIDRDMRAKERPSDHAPVVAEIEL
jgi:exodeoxyribonuclease-3